MSVPGSGLTSLDAETREGSMGSIGSQTQPVTQVLYEDFLPSTWGMNQAAGKTVR